MTKDADDFQFALVLKFSHSWPFIEKICLHVMESLGLMEIPTISFMDAYHVLIQLQFERDFVHAWARESKVIDSYIFKLFWWTKDFDLHMESSLAPQWIFLLGLLMHMYRTNCLQILATRFGWYLGTNNATFHRTRALGACICVKVDLKEEPVKSFFICVT